MFEYFNAEVEVARDEADAGKNFSIDGHEHWNCKYREEENILRVLL